MRTDSLGRRLLLTNIALVTGLLVIAIVALVGLQSLQGSLRDAVEEYEELRLIERAVHPVSVARTMLMARTPDIAAVAAELETAAAGLAEFQEFQLHEDARAGGGGRGDEEAHQFAEAGAARLAEVGLRSWLEAFRSGRAEFAAAELRPLLDDVQAQLGRLEQETESEELRTLATASSASATTITVSALSAAIVLAAVSLSIIGYRSVMAPLRQLQAGVRRLASGEFSERLRPAGPTEIAELSRDFNQMATELDTLYRVMEEEVQLKSRELARSERLASVGFLAAGVAHEINNPLNIITGYAELSQRWLADDGDTGTLEETRRALETIRQEAFRCKHITEQLLTLARGDTGVRKRVVLAHVARDVATLVRGLRAYRDRRFTVEEAGRDDAVVIGSEAELKQVLLNLVVNALEATDPDRGEVVLQASREDDEVLVTISDNGHGLRPEEIERIFEPFYSRRAGGGPRGHGLGLSICHAIIEAHGGQIRVESDGPGRGSRVTVTLPAAVREHAT